MKCISAFLSLCLIAAFVVAQPNYDFSKLKREHLGRGVIAVSYTHLTLEKVPQKVKTINKQPNASIAITETPENIQIETGVISVFIPQRGDFLIDSLLYKGTKVGEKARLI